MIPQVTSRPDAPQHLQDLAWLRRVRVRDRIGREYAQDPAGILIGIQGLRSAVR